MSRDTFDEKSFALRTWWAARVGAIRGGRVYLTYGKKEEAASSAEYGGASVTRRELERWMGPTAAEALEPGRFLEVGFYGTEKDRLVRAFMHSRDRQAAAHDIETDSSRYFRQTIA